MIASWLRRPLIPDWELEKKFTYLEVVNKPTYKFIKDFSNHRKGGSL